MRQALLLARLVQKQKDGRLQIEVLDPGGGDGVLLPVGDEVIERRFIDEPHRVDLAAPANKPLA